MACRLSSRHLEGDKMSFSVNHPISGVLHLRFNSKIEQNLSMCRISEYFESPFEEIRDKIFTVDEFLKLYQPLSYEGKTFWEYFEGFNVPAFHVNNFYKNFIPTQREISIRSVWFKGDYKYLISDIETCSSDVLAHELAHANFAIDEDYHELVTTALQSIDTETFKILANDLKKIGYHDGNIADELHAYLLTSTDEELTEIFSVKLTELKEIKVIILAQLKLLEK